MQPASRYARSLALAALIAPASILADRIDTGWAAWRDGDAARAAAIAGTLTGASAAEARHLLTITAAARGRFDEALDHYGAIPADYARLGELDDPVFHAYAHLGRLGDAAAFAASRGQAPVRIAQAKLRAANPLRIEIDGVVSIPFHDDPLTPAMPGMAIRMNGAAHIGRLDTGGTWAHLSPTMAEELGVEAENCFTGFANLQQTQVCRGLAELAIGGVRAGNVPVAVIDALPSGKILGGQLGPVLGTNLLQQFLATVDTTGGRLVLSDRSDPEARAAHLAQLGSIVAEVPFLMVGDHYLIARGTVDGSRQVNLFVDSGLLAFDGQGRQATLLGTQSIAAEWSGGPLEAGSVQALGVPVALGDASVEAATMLVLPDAAWTAFGDFGGVRVDALISNGFLRHYRWTLDFDRYLLILSTGS